MIQNATVIKLNGKNAVIAVKRQSACGENCHGCSAECKNIIKSEAENKANAQCGDEVLVYSDTKKTLFLAFKLYLLPILLLLLPLCLYETKKISLTIALIFALVIVLLWVLIIKKSSSPKRTIVEVINKK